MYTHTHRHTHRGYFLLSCCFIVFADPISLLSRCDFSQRSYSHGSPADLRSSTALTETMQHNHAFSLGGRNNVSSWSIWVISSVWMEWLRRGFAGLWFWPLLEGLTQVYEVRCNSFIFLNTHSKHTCTQSAIYSHYAATETKALPECRLVAYSFIFDHYFKWSYTFWMFFAFCISKKVHRCVRNFSTTWNYFYSIQSKKILVI